MTRSDSDRRGRAHPPRMGFRVAAVVLAAGLVLAGCGDDDSGAAADSDPAAVIAAYEAAFNTHDLDAVVAAFAPDAVIIGHPRRDNDVEGADEIRTVHAELFDLAAAENAYVFVDIEVTGSMVAFDSTFTNDQGACFPSPGHNVEVKDGRISRWDFGATDQPCN